jgi:hypothetical protein
MGAISRPGQVFDPVGSNVALSASDGEQAPGASGAALVFPITRRSVSHGAVNHFAWRRIGRTELVPPFDGPNGVTGWSSRASTHPHDASDRTGGAGGEIQRHFLIAKSLKTV